MKRIILGLLLFAPSAALAAPISADYFNATDTAATSTFSGDIAADGQFKFGLGTGLLSIVNGFLGTAAINAPLTFSANTLGCQMATSTQDGCLSAADWVRFNSASGGSPAGSNKQIQYNNSGAFGANTNFVFDPSTGFLGVGTSTQYRSNEFWEFVSQTSNSSGGNFVSTNYNSGGASPVAAIVMRTARGTMASPSAVLMNDILGRVSFSGFNGSSFPQTSPVTIGGYAGENWSSSAQGSGIQFFTTGIGTTTRTEKMRITPNGDLFFSPLSFQGERHITIASPSTNDTTGTNLIIDGLQGTGTHSGGVLVLKSGASGTTGGGDGGYLELQAGRASAGDGDGGDIVLKPGYGSGTGLSGHVKIWDANGGQTVTFDTSPLVAPPYNSTITFPNANGTLGLLENDQTWTGVNTFSRSGTTTITLDSTGSQGSCIVMKDSDGSGYSYITVNDGVLSASSTPCN